MPNIAQVMTDKQRQAAVVYAVSTSTNHGLYDDARCVDLPREFSDRFSRVLVDVRVDVRPNTAAVSWQVRHRYTVHNVMYTHIATLAGLAGWPWKYGVLCAIPDAYQQKYTLGFTLSASTITYEAEDVSQCRISNTLNIISILPR